MIKIESCKFSDEELNRKFLELLRQNDIKHDKDEDGMISYEETDHCFVENELKRLIRKSVFEQWQIITFPNSWRDRYVSDLKRHKIPYREEIANGKLWFLIPGKYRPTRWAL